MKHEYIPRGVCARKMTFEIEDGKLHDFKVVGGCNGNSQGISRLVEGMDVDEIITRLDGIICGYKNTSCPAQLALALRQLKDKNEI